MAGRAVANAENVLPRRFEAEHVVKSRNAGNGGGLNLGQLRQPLQGLLRQVAMMFLQRLKNRDQRLGFAPDTRHRLFDKIEINA